MHLKYTTFCLNFSLIQLFWVRLYLLIFTVDDSMKSHKFEVFSYTTEIKKEKKMERKQI